MIEFLAKVELPDGGAVVLRRMDGVWEAEDPADEYAALMAEGASLATLQHLPFSPSQGSPGALAAHEIAQTCGGKLTLPAIPADADTDVVF